MVCGNFILPEPASYVFFYAFSNLRNLLYIIGGYTPLAPLMRLSLVDLPSANGFDKPFAASKFED